MNHWLASFFEVDLLNPTKKVMGESKSIMERVYEKHLVIPSFNMPYIPMMKPVVKALQDSSG
jgi:hypothetical protein